MKLTVFVYEPTLSSLYLPHDSVMTRPFGFVTFTPNCFALAMISTRFFDDTAWAILYIALVSSLYRC